MKNRDIKFIVIDLFCGAGGVTTGFIESGVAVVAACINHDELAIKSHALNHPECHHFTEDIRHFNIDLLIPIIEEYKQRYPNAKVILWASAECTNFSNAKGGLPRDADSRSLPNHLIHYLRLLQAYIDIFACENVKEFQSWGEMDEKGKPISRKKGIFYLRWVKEIQSLGYYYDFRIMNAADFGAFQSRDRWFGCFAKKQEWIKFPVQTHAKKIPKKSTIDENEQPWLKPHNAVREVLKLDVIGNAVFDRKKPLSDNTLMRILKGLKRYGHKKEAFLMRNNNPGYCRPLDEVCGTVTCVDTNYVIQPLFLQANFGNAETNPRIKDLDDAGFTVTTHNRQALCSVQWIDRQYGRGTQHTSIEQPCGTLTTIPKTSLATASFLINPQYSNTGNDINKPCPTVIASQHKRPLQLATVHFDDESIDRLTVKETDSEVMVMLKKHCLENGISNLFLRQLLIEELLRIQGFPKTYKLLGSKAKQAYFIGNAVEVTMCKSWALALAA